MQLIFNNQSHRWNTVYYEQIIFVCSKNVDEFMENINVLRIQSLHDKAAKLQK
jgi:hypothetical protein